MTWGRPGCWLGSANAAGAVLSPKPNPRPGLAAISNTAALAQAASNPNEQEIMLIQLDFSDCQNGNVSDRDPTLQKGVAWVVRGSDGTTRVKVAMTAKPNMTYHFFLKCVRLLGDIKTGDEGEGYATFEFPTNSTGNVFAFDMYPEGAPLGNKFQSVQVKY